MTLDPTHFDYVPSSDPFRPAEVLGAEKLNRATFRGDVFSAPRQLPLKPIGGEAEVKERIFPVRLTQFSGTQGDSISPATWAYNIYDVESGTLLARDVDPTTPPHGFVRPSIGFMTKATHGIAFRLPDVDGPILLWINESVEQAACDT